MGLEDVTLDQLTDGYTAAAKRVKELEASRDRFKAEIIQRLKAGQLKSVQTKDGRKITLVEGETSTWDEDVLRDILGPERWDKVQKMVLDKDRLEGLVNRGETTELEIMPALKVTDKAPYIRVSG